KQVYDTLLTNQNGILNYKYPQSQSTLFGNLYNIGYYAAKENFINSEISYIPCRPAPINKNNFSLYFNYQYSKPFCLPGSVYNNYIKILNDSTRNFVAGKVLVNNYFKNTTDTLDYSGADSANYSINVPINTKLGMYKMLFKGFVEGDSTTTVETYLIVTDFIDFREIPISVIENPASTFQLYPNPAIDYLWIKSENQQFEIYNVLGIKVIESNNENTIYIGNLSPGMYFLKSGGKFYKFIKI
ncbi:MAG: T9SS type A sorting domain-containing protein, partial [Bacteroidota bacterium]